jgi:polysaccharide pyruvyl transferase WcaK-like protein
MIKTLSPKVYEMYAGHSLETGMNTYSHLDNDDLRQELYDKVFQIQELTSQDKTRIEELEIKQEQEKKEYLKMFESLRKKVQEVEAKIKN